MKSLLTRRIFAFLLDYCFILLYALTIFGFNLWLQDDAMSIPILSPWRGELLGFISLTLPAFLCFFLSEKSSWKASPGKRLMRIQVNPDATTSQLFKRNFFKLLPWEIAHAGVHWLVYYDRAGQAIPAWVFVLLILPQVVMLGYVLSVIRSKGGRSLYDGWAGVRIQMR